MKLLSLVLVTFPFFLFGQKLQLQKNLESVSKVIQSPNGDYLLAKDKTNYILIDQKSKIQLASMEIDFNNNGAIGQGNFQFYDNSKFILNTSTELLLINLLNKEIDTLDTKIKFPEIIENFNIVPTNPNKVIITTKIYPIEKDGTIKIVNKKKDEIFYEDLKNCKIKVYDFTLNKVIQSIDFPFSITTITTNETNEILAGTFDGSVVKISEDLNYELLFKAFDRPVFSIVNKKNTFLVVPHRGKNLIFDSGEGDLYFFDNVYRLTNKLPILEDKSKDENTNLVTGIKTIPNNYVLTILNPKQNDFIYINYGFNGLLKVNMQTLNYSKLKVTERTASFYSLNFDNSQIVSSISNETSMFGNFGKLYLYDLQSEKFVDAFRTIQPKIKFNKINKVFYNKNYYYVANQVVNYKNSVVVFSSNSSENITLKANNIYYNYDDNGLLIHNYDRLVYGNLKLNKLSKRDYNFKFKETGWNATNSKDSLHLDIFTPIFDIENYDSNKLPVKVTEFKKISDDAYLISGFGYNNNETLYSFHILNAKQDILFEKKENKYLVLNEIKVSASGKYIATRENKDTNTVIEIWDWINKKLVFSKKIKSYELSKFSFDTTTDTFWFGLLDENYFATYYSFNLELENSQPIQQFSKLEQVGDFLPNGINDFVLFGNVAYKLSTKEKIWQSDINIYAFDFVELQPLPNGVGFGFENNFISVDTNFKSVFFTVYEGNKSIESNDDLFYKADKEAINNFGFVFNGKGYLPSDYDYYFNRPDIIIKESGSTNEDYQKLIEKAVLKRTNSLKKINLNNLFEKAPLMTITNAKSINAFTKSNSQQFDLSFHPIANKYITSYSFYVNGVTIVNSELLKKELSVSQNIILSQGKNLIQINCIDNEGFISNTETFTIYADYKADDPKVYVVIIAADTYDNRDFNLKYSVKDANDLVNHLKKRYGANLIVSTLINKNANEELINQIKNTVKAADVNDKIIVFVSGHGVLDSNLDFRFATPNMDFSKPNEFGITSKTLEQILLVSPARNKLLMIDACHSGEFDKEEYSNTISKDAVVVSYSGSKGSIASSSKTNTESSFELMRQLFNDVSEKKGIKVVSAAAGNSFALESEQWKNGVFTYSLLNVLEKNKTISISKISKEVADSVIKLTNSKQKPTCRGNTVEFDFEL
jgi:hypothetical protein